MDNWFLELFNIINRQTEERKVERLLPELYSEFDILARNDDAQGLKELYRFLQNTNPIHTPDKEYNIEAYEKLKRNLLKRMVMIDDLSIIEQELLDLITSRKRKASKEYVASWEDYTYVHERLMEILTSSGKSSKPTKKIEVEKPEPEIEDNLEQPEEIIPEEPIHEESKTSEPERIDEIIEVPDLEPEPVIENEPEPELEPVIFKEPEPAKSTPKVVKESKKPTPVIIEDPEPVEEISEDEDVVEETVIEEEPLEIIKQEPKKPISTKPRIADTVIKPKSNPIKQATISIDLFFDFLDVVTDKYSIIINIEALRKLSNPKPSFFRMFLGYIDEEERDEAFFIDLINYLYEYNLHDLVSYIAEKSIRLKKLCIYNLGLLNITNTEKKFELIFLLSQENQDYIQNSLLERELRVYIDSLPDADEVTDTIFKHCENITKIAPKQIDTSTAIEALSYFKNHVSNTHNPIIDNHNPTHLYWAMILSASLCIYVARDKDHIFTGAMDFVSKKAVELIHLIKDEDKKISFQKLAIDYVKRIYNAGQKCPEYVKWWDRQRDDFFDQKIKAVQYIRSSN